MEKADIKSWNQKELEDFLVSLGEKPFRAKQIYPWLHVKHADCKSESHPVSHTDIPYPEFPAEGLPESGRLLW